MQQNELFESWREQILLDLKARPPVSLTERYAAIAARYPQEKFVYKCLLDYTLSALKGNHEAALGSLFEILKEHPNYTEGWLHTAKNAAHCGEWEIYRSALMRYLLQEEPEFPWVINLSIIMRLLGQDQALLDFLKKLSKRCPNHTVETQILICEGDRCRQESPLQSLDFYKRAHALNPGLGIPFNRILCHQLRSLGIRQIPPLPSTKGTRTLTVPEFGSSGRFGDTFHQYIVLKAIERHWHYELQLPDWYGRYMLANASEPMLAGTINPARSPSTVFKYLESRRSRDDHLGLNAIQLKSLAEDPEFLAIFEPLKNSIIDELQFIPVFREIFDSVSRTLRRAHSRTIVMHIRRGDFAPEKSQYFTPTQLYLDWLEENSDSFADFSLYLASDDAAVVRSDFSSYPLKTLDDLELEILPGFEFLYDLAAVACADVFLAAQGSAFSRCGILLNPNNPETFSADAENKRFIPKPLPFME